MSISERILKIDALLDQLDAFAESHPDAIVFWGRWFEALRSVTKIEGCKLLFRADLATDNPRTLCLFTAGAVNGENNLVLALNDQPRSASSAQKCKWAVELLGQLEHAASSSPEDPNQAYQRESDETVDPIVDGFMQVATRYMHLISAAKVCSASNRSPNHLPLSMARGTDKMQFIRAVTEDWTNDLNAERISFFEVRRQTAKLVTTTGHSKITHQTDAIKALERTASEYLHSRSQGSGESIAYQQDSENSYLLQFLLSEPTKRRELGIIQIQWSTLTALIKQLDGLPESILFVQAGGSRLLEKQITSRAWKRGRRYLTAILIFFAGLVALWTCKDIETIRNVGATGYAHPVIQRVVYAHCDGYVNHLAVEQDQAVSAGDLLLTLRSPTTELALQDLEGEIAAATQQRAGLQVALNEVRNERSTSGGLAFQIAAEIAGLDARLAGLDKQRTILNLQIESYHLRSPINGTITSQDVGQVLTSKPVVTGEPLLKICDLQGNWQLSLNVDQRDIVTVLREAENENVTATAPLVNFRFLNEPTKVYQGTITSIENQVEQSQISSNFGETKQVVRVTVSIDPSNMPNLQIDSSVVAKINCGSDKWWKNMTKELLDMLRRRFWINV